MLVLLFASLHPIVLLVAKSNPGNQYPMQTGDALLSKLASEIIFDLRKGFSLLNYGESACWPGAPS